MIRGAPMPRTSPVGAMVLGLLTFGFDAQAHDVTFQDRVAAQEAIERVFWSHRTGTQHADSSSRPTFAEAVPGSLLANKVSDYMRKSEALAQVWGRPVTSEQLQAEMSRMASSTRDPEMLSELFAALEHDPVLIAETLARQNLVDRLVRERYAYDSDIHRDVRLRAAEAVSGLTDPTGLRVAADGYEERTWTLDEASVLGDVDPSVEHVDATEWGTLIHDLAARYDDAVVPTMDPTAPLDVAPRSATSEFELLPVYTLSALHEERDAFVVTVILDKDESHMHVARGYWPKRSFDSWWGSVRNSFAVPSITKPDAFLLPATTGTRCNSGEWRPTAAVPQARSFHSAVWTGAEMIVWGTYEEGGAYNPATDTWRPTSTEGAPETRASHTAVWTGSRMIVWGGSASAYLNSGGIYDPIADTWTAMSVDGAPEPRVLHTAVWTGDRMLVWGGFRSPNIALGSGGRYDPLTNRWEPISTQGAPTPRYYHTAVWANGAMLVWGGRGASALAAAGARYDPVSDSWTPIAVSGSPSARLAHVSVWTGTKMVVWSGITASSVTNTGGIYDPVTDTWRLTSTVAAPEQRERATAVWTGAEMIVWGGYRFGGMETGGRYNPVTDTWAPTTINGAPLGRGDHTAVWTGTEMIVWGGIDLPLPGGRYDPARDSWVMTSMGPSPTARSGHSAVWTGAEMIVWGGLAHFETPTDSGGRYYPATDSWQAMSVDAPSKRTAHTAVWTGTEMIVWGGLFLQRAGPFVEFVYLDSGGRYDPLNDTWTPTAATGAPSRRWRHSAVWTGNEMIVFGGRETTRPWSNSGALYDPRTDTWRATSAPGTLAVRASHAAVWTGTEMIVWGGEDSNSQPTSVGDRFNPETGAWTPMSRQGAPVPRLRHSTIWTGTEMIIWGGSISSNSGGRYDPATDTWAPTSTVNAPSAREQHTAVWTKESMIVWGGYAVAPLVSGGRYLPSIDSWEPVTTAHAPTPRTGHSAVWAGTEMIVWGGWGVGSQVTESGGRYCLMEPSPPVADAGLDQVLECQSAGMTVVGLDGSSSSDPNSTPGTNDDIALFEWIEDIGQPSERLLATGEVASAQLSLGAHYITLRVTDSNGESATDDLLVTVADTTPPSISVALEPPVLWPPNHRMVSVAASVVARDTCSPTTVTLTSVTSSEADDGDGDGSTVNDIQSADIGTPDEQLSLRAERGEGGSGRTYTVTYTAFDGSGNVATDVAIVYVPHDLGGVTNPIDVMLEHTVHGTVLYWTDAPGALSYDVIRGTVSSFRETPTRIDLGAVVCIEEDSADTSTTGFEDQFVPAPGSAFFYLVQYNDGTNSSYGSEDTSKPRAPGPGACASGNGG